MATAELKGGNVTLEKTPTNSNDAKLTSFEADWDGGLIGDWYRETHYHGNGYHSNKQGQGLDSEKILHEPVLTHKTKTREDQPSTSSAEKSIDLNFLEKSILAKFDSDFDLGSDLDLKERSVKNFSSDTKDFDDQWDSQYDFKELESPNKKGNTTSKRRSSLSGQRVKDALSKGREFIRAKVCSCRKKIFRSAVRMKTGENKDGSVIHNLDGESNGLGGKDGGVGESKGRQLNKGSVNGHDARSTSADGMSVKNDLDPNNMTETNDLEADGDTSVEVLAHVNGNDFDLESKGQEEETENTGTDDLDPPREDGLDPPREDDLDPPKEDDLDPPIMPKIRRKSVYLIDREELEIPGHENNEYQVSKVSHPDTVMIYSEPKSKISINIVKEDREEEIPLGTDAQHFTDNGRPIENQQIKDNRLLWLQGNSENRSFGSDFSHNTTTSNSSDISLDMLLQDRYADPEEVLTNLGFTSGSGDVISRVPNRFLSNTSAADGALITSLIEDNDQLQQLLALSEHEDLLDQIQTSQLSNNMNSHDHPHLGNVLASVMSGMRFLSAVNQSHTFSSSLESKSDNESVLQNPKNREFLEKQGYYLRHSMDKKVESPLSKTGSGPDGKATKLSKAMSLDASERRKKFHQTRSRNFSQLETSGSDEPSDRGSYDDKRTGGFSRSFTSFENSDSFDSAEFNESRESPMDVFTQFSDDDLPQRSKVSLGDISPGLFNRRKTFSVDSKERSSEELIEPEEILGHATVPRTSAYSGGLQKIAELRKNQVNRFMTMQDADEDYVVSPITSPNLSKEPSLESTLTVTDMQKLKKKSSTLKNDSVFDDVDGEFTERETTPLASPKNVTFKLGDSRSQESEYPEGSVHQKDEESDRIIDERTKETDLNSNLTNVSAPGTGGGSNNVISGDVDFKERQNVPPLIPSIDIHDDTDYGIDVLGGMGRMESIQSDSSGFADGDAVTGDAVQEERASSLGSSVESDQTFRSFITVVGDQPPSPRLQVISPYSHDRNVRQEEPPSFRKVDVAVGTDDLNFLEEIPKSKEEVTLTPGGRIIDSRGETVKDKPYTSSVSLTPTITYQLHQRDKEKTTLDESGEDNSVVLTIELPTEWLQNGPSDTPPKSSVVSTLYKHIGPPQNMPKNSDKVASSTNDLISSSRHHATSSNSIDHSKTLTAKRQSYLSSSRVHPQWSSTPSVNVAKRQIPKLSENLTRSQIVSPKRTLFSKLEEDNRPKMPKKIAYHSEDDLLGSRPLSPSSVSDMDEFILPIRSNRDNPHTYRRFNRDLSFEDSNASLLSASESCLSLPGENMEYKKLLRLVNKPVSKKGHNSRYRTRTSVREWNYLEKQELLEEEIHLLQKALAKYRADLNSMEMVFTVKNKMAGSDMTPDERDELEQLKQIWEEVRMEIVETEQLLEQRLAGLAVGNDQFNPMLAMDVIHKMTDLLKEQLYQYQICVDSTEEADTMETPTHNPSVSPWQPDVSQPKWGLPHNRPHTNSQPGDSSLHESLLELRDSILQEVRQEREEMQWLHRELKNRDKELGKLRQEVLSNNVKTGTTRQKVYFESDV